MNELECDDDILRARVELLQQKKKRYKAYHLSENLSERIERAALHCRGNGKALTAPITELYCQDAKGLIMKETVDLRNLTSVSDDWILAIASHAATAASSIRTFLLANTSITDIGITHLTTLKSLTSLDISSCHRLTDDGLSTLRRHCTALQALSCNDCRHFSSLALCQVWKECTHLHTLAACRCPGVTDRFLDCLATTARTSAGTLQSLDIRHCQNITSTGIASLASSLVIPSTTFHLAIDDCLRVQNVAFFEFATSSSLCALQSLSLQGLAIDETAIYWIVQGCRGLQRLDVKRCTLLSDVALQAMAPLIASPVFLDLTLSKCPLVTDRGIQKLFSLAEKNIMASDDDGPHISLTTLNLKHCGNIGDDAMVCVGQIAQNLEKLHLQGLKRVSDKGLVAIAKGCPSLRTLSLSGRHITLQTFRILGALCRKLHNVRLSDRHDLESPACWRHLFATASRPFHPLQRIDLSATNICDAGVHVLARACQHQLTSLTLSKCPQITDAAIEALASCCFQLKRLWLAHTRGISDRALLALARTEMPLVLLDLTGNVRVTTDGLLALCARCQEIQDLRLQGCERLDPHRVKHCHATLLPFTTWTQKPRKSANLTLQPLPAAHIACLRVLHARYVAAARLQATVRQWQRRARARRVRATYRKVRATQAARQLERGLGAFVAWRRVLARVSLRKHLVWIVFVQAHVRGNKARRDVRRWRRRATIAIGRIQRWYRRHYVARRTENYVHARNIQRIFRGLQGRQRVQRIVDERNDRSTRTIRRWYRRWYHYRRWRLDAIRTIQKQWRTFQQRQKLRQYVTFYCTAARKVQRAWRRKVAIGSVSTLRIKVTRATVLIQRTYRGHVARKRLALDRKSALRLQSHWRRYWAQRRYLHQRQLVLRTQQRVRDARMRRQLHQLHSALVQKIQNDACKQIQRAYRGMVGRKRAVLVRTLCTVNATNTKRNAVQRLRRRRFIMTGAVLCIQDWLRRLMRRRKVLERNRRRQYHAVKCIQKYLKNWVTTNRQKGLLTTQLDAIAQIQRISRGYFARQHLQLLRHQQAWVHAAQLIQRVVRGHLGRQAYVQLLHAKVGAARKLQRVYRSRQAAKVIELTKAAAALNAFEKSNRSLFDKIDARRHPMRTLYHRAKLHQDQRIVRQVKDKWEAHWLAKQRAKRKVQRACASLWQQDADGIAAHFRARYELHGVTETVYALRQELTERQKVHGGLQTQGMELRKAIALFKQALRAAVTSQRMLDGAEILDLLKEHHLGPEVFK